jgi:hypothetical protein
VGAKECGLLGFTEVEGVGRLGRNVIAEHYLDPAVRT